MEWLDIEDRKPPLDVYVLTAVFDHRPGVKMHFVQICSRFGNTWVDDKDGEPLDPNREYVTHWMPLPDPPESKNIA